MKDAVRQEPFFLGKIEEGNDAPAVVVLIAGAAAKTRKKRVNLRRLNRADQAGESFNEIAHIAFYVAQVVMPRTTFGEMLEIFFIHAFNSCAVPDALAVAVKKVHRFLQRAGFEPLL